MLLAEDNAISREMFLEMLSLLGMAADAAENGAQALAMAERQAYDLILMDLQMPKMDGTDAARAIRSLPAHRNTPIVAITAGGSAHSHKLCRDAGMNDYLVKPAHIETLGQTLSKWLSNGGGRVAEEVGGDFVRTVKRPGEPVCLDAAHGLALTGGDLEKYRRLMRSFVDRHTTDVAALREHEAAGRWPEARRLAHSVVGSASMTGAFAVQAAAERLERALESPKSGSAPTQAIERLEAELKRLADTLDAMA